MKRDAPDTGVMTAEVFERVLLRRLDPQVWGAIARCGGMARHNRALMQHMLRKTVVTVVGQSWTGVAPNHVIDGYNRQFNFDPNMYSDKPTSHHDLPPATIMAVYNDDVMSGSKIS